ncbi:MAG: NAD(P)-dependent oxidoreductase [Muribaculaceae bacterium]|nr:NAD(P)-dependent oxidoreductase [Muribaculaceae bacterium]
MNSKTILIVGAGGFIGGFIARKALEKGYDTWVGVRKSTSRRYLSDSRLHIVEFDYDDTDSIDAVLQSQCPRSGRWDYIIWNLGATKCENYADFNRINCTYLEDFVESLLKLGKAPERFLFMSSLSALGPGDEKNYIPLTDKTIPSPNTRYGVSKIKAETFLDMKANALNWIVFRPTGVYGPHEKDYLMMIKSIDRGFDVGMGYKRQMLTFIYVEDLVDAMFDALEAPAENVIHKKFIISEDRAYTQKEFRDIVKRHLGKKTVVPVKLPMWIVLVVSALMEKMAVAKGKTSTLNRDKFKIMKQRNWTCDITGAVNAFGFVPRWNLDKGMEETIKAYLAEKQQKKKS